MRALLLVLLAPVLSRAEGPDANAPSTGFDPSHLGLLRTIAPMGGELGGIAFSQDGRFLAVGCGQGARVYETGTGRLVARLEGSPDAVHSVALAPDGRRLAAGGEDGTLVLWDVAEGKLLHALRFHTMPVNALVFSPDGTALVSGSQEGRARVWDPASGKALSALDEGNGAVWAAAFSRDGSRVAVAGDGDSIRVYRARGWQLDRRLKSGPVTALGFSADGSRIAGHGEGATTLWDASTGTELRKADLPLSSGRFTPDARFFVGGRGADVSVWDLAQPREPAKFAHHSGAVTGVAVHPHGRLFATIGQDRHLKMWGPAPGGMSRVRGKGFLGVTVQNTANGRVVISTLYEGSAAQAAGLRVGDLILKVAGQTIETMTQAVDQIGSFQEGDELEFEIDRGGDVQSLKATLRKRPPTMPN